MPISDHIRKLRQKVGHELLMLPSVSAVIVNSAGHFLLQRMPHDGRWYTAGGAIDPGETPAEAVVREIREETGLEVVPVRIVGVYVDPIVEYENGDRTLYVNTCFLCRIVGSEALVKDDESLDLGYFPGDALPDMNLTHRHRIEQAKKNEQAAYFQWNNE